MKTLLNKLILKLKQWSYDCDGMCGFYEICKECKQIKKES